MDEITIYLIVLIVALGVCYVWVVRSFFKRLIEMRESMIELKARYDRELEAQRQMFQKELDVRQAKGL